MGLVGQEAVVCAWESADIRHAMDAIKIVVFSALFIWATDLFVILFPSEVACFYRSQSVLLEDNVLLNTRTLFYAVTHENRYLS